AAFRSHLCLLGQVGHDMGVRLQPAQNIRTYEATQRSEGMGILALIELLDVLLELLGRAEQAGTAKVEQRPEIAEMVLDRRAREHEPAAGLQVLDGACLGSPRILDGLSFIEHDEGPA